MKENNQQGNLLDFLLESKPTIKTITHPIICIGCHNLIVERNQQDNGCRYCCEFDETGEFHDKCQLNTDGDTSDRFDEGFIMKNGK